MKFHMYKIKGCYSYDLFIITEVTEHKYYSGEGASDNDKTETEEYVQLFIGCLL